MVRLLAPLLLAAAVLSAAHGASLHPFVCVWRPDPARPPAEVAVEVNVAADAARVPLPVRPAALASPADVVVLNDGNRMPILGLGVWDHVSRRGDNGIAGPTCNPLIPFVHAVRASPSAPPQLARTGIPSEPCVAAVKHALDIGYRHMYAYSRSQSCLAAERAAICDCGDIP